MTDRSYLYGWGTRRHIRDDNPEWQYRQPEALCGMYGGRPEPQFFEDQRKWYTPKVAARRIARFQAMPVCQHCEREEAKRG